jgi:hypothetical protein
MAIMSRRDDAARRDPHSHQPLMRPIASRT